MSLAAIDAFDSAVAEGTPDPVYLLYGDDDFLKEEKLREAVDQLAEPSTREFNVDYFHGADASAAGVSQALDSLPMLATRRVVVIRALPALKKDARAVLDRYVTRPSSSTVLLLVAPSGWKPEAALTARATALVFHTLDDRAMLAWIGTRATALGLSVEPDAARLLMAATGPDLGLLDGELEKLRDFATTGRVTTADVDAIVGATAGHTATDLVDLVCARDARGAVALVQPVLRQPKTTAVGIVMSLTVHMLGIGQVLVDRANRVSSRQQAANLYTLLGESRSTSPGRPWGDAVSTMTAQADRWDSRAVDVALGLLADADRALKDAGASSDAQILATLSLAMCGVTRTLATPRRGR